MKDAWAITSASTKKVDLSEGKVKMETLEVRIDPRAEWPQIFDEAWRINRDYFYDPHMHGVDWKAMKEKYARLPAARRRSRRREPRDPVDVQRALRRVTTAAEAGTSSPSRPRSRAAFSAPTTPSRTAATASRRCTAA